MIKISKKILFVLIALVFILSMTTSVFATDSGININTVADTETNNDSNNSNTSNNANGTTSLEIVENNVCTIEIEDLARFEKKITAFDETEKSVTLTLTLTNLKTVEETNKDVEIFFVIDNSSSMTEDYIGDQTRKQVVINSANSLVDKIFAENSKAKVGVVGFSSSPSAEGTIADGSLRQELTNSSEEVKTAISNLSELEVGDRTNIDAGVTIAKDNFSSDENVKRYIILLTDGVPNNDINGNSQTYSDEVLNNTKAKLESIEQSGIEIIASMINLDDTQEPTTGKTYRELAEAVFGTEENPTTSKYFYVPDSEIEDNIINEIFDSLVITTDNTLRNITITDYFPQEIIDNFNFEYVATPNIGEVSQTINTENNSITWNIELLSEGETASLSYKLTLKDDYDKDIIDVILKTNDKVEITGEDNNGPIDEESDVSPTIRVTYEEPGIVPDEDNTVSPKPIPQTGENSLIILSILMASVIIFIVARILFFKKNS